MPRRASTSEPAFGSDSFLDVMANLVGVLIILIVLVGLRVAKAPPETFLAATNAELTRRLSHAHAEIEKLGLERDELEFQVERARRELEAKKSTLTELNARDQAVTEPARGLAAQSNSLRAELQTQSADLAGAHDRLASLASEMEQPKATAPAPRELVWRSPLSRPVESEEIHFEIRGGRVAFVDLAGLMERARGKSKSMEAALRERGRATTEVGPVGSYRLRFTMAREDMPFTQSLLYGSGSFRARMVEWEILPTADLRGEPIETALGPGSQFRLVFERWPANKVVVTLWTDSDSFPFFRRLRDDLSDRGYAVAARPLPPGTTIRGSVHGSRSFAQ